MRIGMMILGCYSSTMMMMMLWVVCIPSTMAFMVVTPSSNIVTRRNNGLCHTMAMLDDQEEDDSNEDGKSLAADFSKLLQERNIQLERDDLLEAEYEDDDEDDEEDEEEEEMNFPQGAINAMTGFDPGDVGKLAGNVTLTNQQVYSELKERVLESAGAFVELVGGADDNDDDDDDEEDGPKPYESPTTVPDSGLTAGEVVTTILMAFRNNDIPHINRGIEVFFGYASPGGAIYEMIHNEGMTTDEYAEFLMTEESSDYQVLFQNEGDIVIEKGDYSFDRKKAFFTARLTGSNGFVNVNFILSTTGHDEDDCWLVDSMLIRPAGMRRRRRR